MADVFWYNSGSLLQALSPEKTLVDLTNDPALKDTDPSFLPAVTQNGKVYGAPVGHGDGRRRPLQQGRLLPARAVGAQDVGRVRVEQRQDQGRRASRRCSAPSRTPSPRSCTSSATSTTSPASNPKWAEEYTANKVKYATDPVALKGFEKAAEPKQKGWLNSSAGSTTFAQGIKQLAQGKAAQYPMLTFPISTLSTADAAKIGFFGIPGDDASKAGATLWLPGGQYIPKTSKNIEAAKKFVAFVASVAGDGGLLLGPAADRPVPRQGLQAARQRAPGGQGHAGLHRCQDLDPSPGVRLPGQGPLAGADHGRRDDRSDVRLRTARPSTTPT